ncbi:MAG TPA: rhomboid family intramembrane serine protease [Flavobacteriales bacterium]|jgi:membrane associated rhomboid family serine protease
MLERLPVVTKNLLIINVLMFLASQVLPETFSLNMTGYFFQSENFRPWQIITHMFMHGNVMHIFFNMFGVYMFGATLEHYWGPKRFLNYYLLCGIGAFGLHQLITYIEVQQLSAALPNDLLKQVYLIGNEALMEGKNFTNPTAANLNIALNVGLVGASGCLFGLLLAYGMMFPNAELFLMFIPVPIKAKWFVIGYGAVELMLALRNAPGDNVAHYAHLGGMIFGYIILKYWQKKGKLYSNE